VAIGAAQGARGRCTPSTTRSQSLPPVAPALRRRAAGKKTPPPDRRRAAGPLRIGPNSSAYPPSYLDVAQLPSDAPPSATGAMTRTLQAPSWRSRGKEGAPAVGRPEGRRPRASLRQLVEIPSSFTARATRLWYARAKPAIGRFSSARQSLPPLPPGPAIVDSTCAAPSLRWLLLSSRARARPLLLPAPPKPSRLRPLLFGPVAAACQEVREASRGGSWWPGTRRMPRGRTAEDHTFWVNWLHWFQN
jgi:hypothetical protein